MPKQPQSATLVERHDVTDTLAKFRFTLSGGVPDFQPGQFITLGLPVAAEEGAVTWRAYSIASPPSTKEHVELYVRHALSPVAGLFTTALWNLPIGAEVQHVGITGPFTIESTRPDGSLDERRLLLIAGGTGIAPFVSQALELAHRRSPRELVVLQGASHVEELAYGDTFARLERETAGAPAGELRVRHVPTVSRPNDERNRGWTGEVGRVESLLVPGAGGTSRAEAILGTPLTPADFTCLVCGYDGTVSAVVAALEPRGFRTRRNRREDGSYDLKSESYG